GAGSIPKTFGNGFAGGGAGISLRGLGAGSTLVLLNGRRMATYGLSGDSDGDAKKATLTAGTGDLATDGWNAFFSLDVGKTDA
ncbi:hypothetical protein EN842_56055, partial [bacterium M00.F.Ca.ET.199.01.1.1]